MKICILGLGYIGLPTAAMIAANGYDVVGVDTNRQRVEALQSGGVKFDEPGLAELVSAAFLSGKLRTACEVEAADVYVICVPTPLREGDGHTVGREAPDLSFVHAAAVEIAKNAPDDALVILESTCPVGTTASIEARFRELGRMTDQMGFAYCPERVLPGNMVHELRQNDRIVGGLDRIANKRSAAFYRLFVEGDIVETDASTAEFCKLVENSFRDVNIAFANEISMLCDQLQISSTELIGLANRHPRVDILNPGIGVGGHCIAIDPLFVASMFPKDTMMIQSARAVNRKKTAWVIDRVLQEVEQYEVLRGKRACVTLLGLSYKQDVGDLRESPALEIAYALQAKGLEVACVDPHVDCVEGLHLLDMEAALSRSNIVIALVRHAEFTQFKFQEYEISVFLDFCDLDLGTSNTVLTR